MSNKQYHQIPALSHSLIVAIKDKGALMAFKESAFNPNREERELTDALAFGQLYHALCANGDIVVNTDRYTSSLTICLNPTAKKPVDEELKIVSVDDSTVLFIYDFGISRRNKAYAAIVEYLQQNNQWTDDAIVCTQAEFDQACDMVRKLHESSYFAAISTYNLIAAEEPIFFTMDGFACKAKPDAIYHDEKTGNYFVIDWKTTKETQREQIQLCGERLGYHLEDFLYRNAVAQEYGVPLDKVEMLLFLQNKECPEIIYLARFNKASYQLADSEFCQHARDFISRLNKFKGTGDIRAWVDQCGVLEFAHFEPRLLEQPD